MLLLMDLGNTSLNVSVYQDRKPICVFKTYSDKLKSESEYQELISQFLFYHHIDSSSLEGGILSSVVPSLTKRIKNAASKILGKECLVVSREIKTGLAIRLDNPSELGSDLICDAIGAVNSLKSDCIVVDIGTAIKILLVKENMEYLGGVIAPGIRLSSESLWDKAAMLSEIEPSLPKTVIGKNTKDSMSIGIIMGSMCLIDGIVRKMISEYGKPVKVVLTGGDEELIREAIPSDYIYLQYNVFDGLYDIFMKNKGKN